MAKRKKSFAFQIRVIHRYLGYFLAGIMAMYAISGIVMIFRETDFLKNEAVKERQLEPNLSGGELSPKLRMAVVVEKKEGDILFFKDGTYNQKTGMATVKKMELPFVLEKMERLHKASTDSPLYFLNIFFWCFTPIFLCFQLSGCTLRKCPYLKRGFTSRLEDLF